MGLFKFFQKKKKQESAIKRSSEKITYNFTSEQLKDMANKTIAIFYKNKEKSDVDDILNDINLLTNNDNVCSDALYRFIPIVLCQKLFHEATYPDYYMEFKSKDDCTEHKYTNDQLYNIVEPLITHKLDNGQLSEDELYAILAHSSTFNALNQALNNGSQLSDLELSPCVFYNPD